jgi:single-strand DNA-binding protein
MNIVLLHGALSSAPRIKELPSGSLLTSWEVTTTVDGAKLSVPVVWFDGPKSIDAVTESDEVVVAGRVKRRYFHAGSRLVSATEVIASRWALSRRPTAVKQLVERVMADALLASPAA